MSSHYRFYVVVLFSILVTIYLGCIEDPPGDGFLYITIRADNIEADGYKHLVLVPERIELQHSKNEGGDAETVVLPQSPPAFTMKFDRHNKALYRVILPVPPGYIHQLRFIAEEVEIGGPEFPGGTTQATVPSGGNTGIKVVLQGGPAVVEKNKITGILISFSADEQVVEQGNGNYKFKTTLKGEITSPPIDNPVVLDEIIVRFTDGTSKQDMEDIIAEFDDKAHIKQILVESRNMVLVGLPAGVDVFTAQPYFDGINEVEYTSLSGVVFTLADNPRPPNSPDDPDFADQGYLQQIDAESAWDRQIGSHQIVIAVLDTGIDLDHPDMVNNLFFNEGEIPSGTTIADADGDGIITFIDLNNPANSGVVVDSNGNGFIDGEDVLEPVANGGLADGVDDDPGPTADDIDHIVDDLVGARIGRFPGTSTGTIHRDNVVDDDFVLAANPECGTDAFWGHGAAVSGVAGAIGNNSEFGTGVAWNVRILPIKIAHDDGSCWLNMALAEGLRYARRMGASIANMSLGATMQDEKWDSDDVDAYLDPFYDQYEDGLLGNAENMLIVIGAGNGIRDPNDLCESEGQDCTLVSTICLIPELDMVFSIAVGAVDDSDNLTDYSDHGAWSSPSAIPIAAPGQNLYLLDSFGGTQEGSGTSFATPQVSATAALLLAQFDATYQGDPEALGQRILDTADTPASLQGDIQDERRLNVNTAISPPDP